RLPSAQNARPPNRCKKLTTRRLLARRPSGRLSQSALRGGALSARPFSTRRTKRAAVSVACEAALQLMRQSLGRLIHEGPGETRHAACPRTVSPVFNALAV